MKFWDFIKLCHEKESLGNCVLEHLYNDWSQIQASQDMTLSELLMFMSEYESFVYTDLDEPSAERLDFDNIAEYTDTFTNKNGYTIEYALVMANDEEGVIHVTSRKLNDN